MQFLVTHHLLRVLFNRFSRYGVIYHVSQATAASYKGGRRETRGMARRAGGRRQRTHWVYRKKKTSARASVIPVGVVSFKWFTYR